MLGAVGTRAVKYNDKKAKEKSTFALGYRVPMHEKNAFEFDWPIWPKDQIQIPKQRLIMGLWGHVISLLMKKMETGKFKINFN